MAVETTTQTFCDEGFFDIYDNADEVLKDYPLTEVKIRRKPSSDQKM